MTLTDGRQTIRLQNSICYPIRNGEGKNYDVLSDIEDQSRGEQSREYIMVGSHWNFKSRRGEVLNCKLSHPLIQNSLSFFYQYLRSIVCEQSGWRWCRCYRGIDEHTHTHMCMYMSVRMHIHTYNSNNKRNDNSDSKAAILVFVFHLTPHTFHTSTFVFYD